MESRHWVHTDLVRKAFVVAFLSITLTACIPSATIQGYDGEIRTAAEIAVLEVDRTCGFAVQILTLDKKRVQPECTASTFSSCTIHLLPGYHELFASPRGGAGTGQPIRFIARAGHNYATRCAERKEISSQYTGSGYTKTYSFRLEVTDVTATRSEAKSQ